MLLCLYESVGVFTDSQRWDKSSWHTSSVLYGRAQRALLSRFPDIHHVYISFSLRQVLCDPADPQQQPLHGGGGQQVWLQHVWADHHEPCGDHVYPSLTKTSIVIGAWSSGRVTALLLFSDTSLFDLCWLWPFQHLTAVCLLSHVSPTVSAHKPLQRYQKMALKPGLSP